MTDKTIKKKTRRKSIGNNDYYIQKYTECAVIIQQDISGKMHRLTAEDDDTLCQISDDLCWRCKCPLLK